MMTWKSFRTCTAVMKMIFHEVYGAYYAAVAEIIRLALDGSLTADSLVRTVREKAFQESVLSIPEALESGRWPFLGPGQASRLRHPPARPLTDLEKQWLKALLSDPRIRLFDPGREGLEDVEPLFLPEDLVYYDRDNDGDPYTDPGYIRMFRLLLGAVKERRRILVRSRTEEGGILEASGFPASLEYSPWRDRFSLRLARSGGGEQVLELSRITDCTVLPETVPPEAPAVSGSSMRRLVLLIRNERNSPERVLLHFSHYRKTTERAGESEFRMTLDYEAEDEEELILRILSFGPTVRVLSPQRIIDSIRRIIRRQKEMRT